MPTVNVRGLRTWYEAAGDPGAACPTVLFLHGAGGTVHKFRQQLPALAASARLVAVDLPGHGLSLGEAMDSIDDYAAWTTDCLDAMGLFAPVVLCGHSMGGAIAQVMALDHPGRVQALVLAGTSPVLGVDSRMLMVLRRGETERRFFRAAYSPAAPEGLLNVEWYYSRPRTRLEATLADYAACSRFDIRDRVDRIACPTLVVTGEDDRLTVPKLGKIIADRVAGARLLLVPNAGHYVMLEQSGVFNPALAEFVAQLN